MRIKANFMLRAAATVVIAQILACAPRAEDTATLPAGLLTAIGRIDPTAKPLAAADVDQVSCGQIPKRPGIVEADFDGDGRRDVSVLLVSAAKGESIEWHGKKLEPKKITFAILMALSNGDFALRLAKSFSDYAPLGVFIARKPPGPVQDRDKNIVVNIRNPGVSLTFCEKSSSVYYVEDGKVRTVFETD